MKIIFNLLNVGLGGNGGSSTIVKSANMLSFLGHDVIIIDGGRNQYTWSPILVDHRVIRNINDIPPADIIIASGIKSLDSTNKSSIRKKVYWCRGWEVWQIPEIKLVHAIKESPTFKIVNSLCLQKKFEEFGIKSYVVRPGYDFDEIFPLNIRKQNKSIILGGLFNSGIKRKSKRTEWIFSTYKKLKEKHNIELIMFGSDGTPTFQLKEYFKNPKINIKNEIYNKCDIWLSPSNLEGLHIAPAEAMLAECPIISTSASMSGTQDYLIHKQTGLISDDNLKDFIRCTEVLIQKKEIRENLGKNAREKIFELGDRKANMERMVKIFQEIK